MLALERSPVFHVFADLLNGAFRVLRPHVPEATLVRLDTEAVAAAVYVGGHALLGALLGAVLRRAPGLARWGLVGVGIFAVDALAFGTVWRHRGLPLGLGFLLVAIAGGLAGGAGAATAIAVRRLPATFAKLAGRALPVAVVVAMVAAPLLAARGPAAPSGRTLLSPVRAETDQKVAIVGVDGLDWTLVDEAVAAGRLPTLARLLEGGVRGDLRSIRPPKSPVVWTSMATGMLPERHGIRDFVVYRDRQRIPVTGNMRMTPALWNLGFQSGYTVAFVNWYVTWPAEPVPGVLVSDRVDFDGLDLRVHPPGLTAAIDSARARIDALSDRDIARFTALGEDFESWRAERWGQVRRAIRILDDVVRHDLVSLEAARVALRAGQPDLTAVYFRGNDNTQHLFWKYRLAARRPEIARRLYEGPSDDDVETLAPVIDRYYDFADELLGEVLSLLEPDTAVLVLSDHGFLTNNERSRWLNPNRLLEAAELAVLVPGGGGAADSATSVVYEPGDPTVSRVRHLRAGGAASSPDRALERARDVLAAAVTGDGRPLFDSLEIDTDESGPRLVVRFAPDLAAVDAVVNGRTVATAAFRTAEGHSGDHAMNGFLLGHGPPFRSGESVTGARAVDIAPTVLHLLGAPAARDMEGVVVESLFTDEWRRAHPVRYVETYGEREGSAEAISTEADEKIREELRALGYIQ